MSHDGTYADDSLLLHQLLTQKQSVSPSLMEPAYYCADCGTAARFMAALLAITPGTHLLDGDSRLRERPMKGLFNALRQGGATVSSDSLPCRITGTDKFADTTLDIAESSQYASALLLVAPYIQGGLRLHLTNTKYAPSKPYIDMTLNVMRQTGIEWHRSGDTITVQQGHYNCHNTQQLMERDWSSAAFCYQAIATAPVGTSLLLERLTLQSLQGDSIAAKLFVPLGVASRQTPQGVMITAVEHPKKPFTANFADTPDLVPSVACTAAALGIEATLSGTCCLSRKESDRTEAIVSNLNILGYSASHDSDNIYIIKPDNKTALSHKKYDCHINCHNDHRIIMAFALLTKDKSLINHHVAKSFPNFYDLTSNAK